MSIGFIKNGSVVKINSPRINSDVIKLPDNVSTELVTKNFSGTKNIDLYDKENIRSYFLYNITSPGLNKITGNKVTSVGDYALSECVINEINLGASVVVGSPTLTIGVGAFKKSKIGKVVLPVNTSVAESAFEIDYSSTASEMKTLTNINTVNITSVGKKAFYNQRGITTLDLSNLTSMGESAFSTDNTNISNTELTTVILDKLATIPVKAFYYQKNLENVTFGIASVISDYAFGFTKIASLVSSNITSIGIDSFREAPLTEVVLPSLTSFTGIQSFISCSSLQKVDIGDSFTNFNKASTFKDCTVLDTLIIRKTSSIATLSYTSVLANTAISAGTGYIYVPRDLIDSYKAASNWSTFTNQFRAIEDYPTICSDTSVQVSTYTEGDILNDGTFTTSGTTRLVSNFIELPIDATTVKLSISNNNDNNNFFIAFYDENQNPHLYNTYNLSAKTDWSDQIDTEMYLPFGAKYIRVGLEYNANYVSSPPVINISYGAYEYIYESLDLSDSTLWENGTTDAQGNPSESSVRLRTIVNHDADKIRNAYLFGKMYDTVNTSPQIDYDLYNDSSTWISYIDYHNIWSRTPGFVPITPLEDSATHLNAKVILKYTDNRTMSSSDVEIIKYYQKSDSSIPMWFEI